MFGFSFLISCLLRLSHAVACHKTREGFKLDSGQPQARHPSGLTSCSKELFNSFTGIPAELQNAKI
jgi:hypothetical protein